MRGLLGTIMFGLLVVAAVAWASPILWSVSTSFKPNSMSIEYPIRWIPKPLTLENYITVLTTNRSVKISLALVNSVYVAIVTVALVVITSALAAYAFARLKFRGRETLFWISISTMFIPPQIILVPRFLLVFRMGLLDNHLALILPSAASAFGVFYLRQFFLSIPHELEDAARIDGCNRFDVFWRIVVPLSKPGVATLALFTFLASWNDFMWPLIVLNSQEKMTVPVALA
ncbi:MAG: carbohydrate ABC transporter permease, partial [Bacillota bacterium]